MLRGCLHRWEPSSLLLPVCPMNPPKDARLDEIGRLAAELPAEGKDFSVERGQITRFRRELHAGRKA